MRLTIIGFGNQARAWCQNLQDSAFPIRVALMPGSASFEKAHALNLETVEIGTPALFEDKAFTLLTPDHTHAQFMRDYGAQFKAGTLMLYNHGFSLSEQQFQKTFPQIQHVLFAVKAIGSEIRKVYLARGKLGAVYSLEHVRGSEDLLEPWLKKMAEALGINMGIFKTTFLRETQADLYSEQGLLCSLVPYTAAEMFRHLVESGIEPELAYFECWHELNLVVKAMVEKGPEGFYDLISPNALVGSEKGFKRLLTPEFKSNLKSLLNEVQDGTFNQELQETDVEELRATIRARWSDSPLNQTFNRINRDPHEKT